METDDTRMLDPNLEPGAEGLDGGEDRVDWKAKAIAAETELRIRTQQAAPAPAEPQVSPLQQAERELQELQAAMPKLDPSNAASFWAREEHREKVEAARARLIDMREQERTATVRALQFQQQAQQAVGAVKARYKSHPAWGTRAEALFDAELKKMRPEAAANATTLEVLMKNILFDVSNGATTPPTPPSGAFQPPRSGGRSAAGKAAAPVQFKSEQDALAASIYGMSAEDYYAPKYNEIGAHTEGNGISIYNLPIGGSR